MERGGASASVTHGYRVLARVVGIEGITEGHEDGGTFVCLVGAGLELESKHLQARGIIGPYSGSGIERLAAAC